MFIPSRDLSDFSILAFTTDTVNGIHVIMFFSFSPVKSLILNVIRNEFIAVHKRKVDFWKAVIANPDVCWNWKQRDRIRKELPLSIRVNKQTNKQCVLYHTLWLGNTTPNITHSGLNISVTCDVDLLTV